MGEFKRSPSKVWWANESVEWREISSSPGSQDSGFSDTETSPNQQLLNTNKNNNETPPTQRIPKDIFKELKSIERSENLAKNFKEKTTPNKHLLTRSETKPMKKIEEISVVKTEPIKKQTKFIKYSPKVNRNLFNTEKHNVDVTKNHQYAKEDAISNEEDNNNNNNDTCVQQTNGLACIYNKTHENYLDIEKLHQYRDDDGVTSFNNSLSSDCESELECLFNAPQHTSTPKTVKMRLKHKFRQNSHERVPPVHTHLGDVNGAVQMWMDQIRHNYEQECMTTLQCKSIVADLNSKVQQMAAEMVVEIRDVLGKSKAIVAEYLNLNSEQKHVGPLIQSLTGTIFDYIKLYRPAALKEVTPQIDKIRTSNREVALKLVSELFITWQTIQEDILIRNVRSLVENLEKPKNELYLKALLTAITSLTLRNEDLVEYFTKYDIIPILLIFCEKCEGSTTRSLLLRALSTICNNSYAVRQFEKYSGVQIIADTIDDESKPEPERSEAIALLAQVTAPWLEDNHNVRGLQDYSRILVKSLTKFVATTKCCQNLLLGTAAIANLSAMDTKCVKFMVQYNTVQIVMEAVAKRGPITSIYVYEQVATLLANLSAVEAARRQIIECKAVGALMKFLQMTHLVEDVARRLQQKAIIALSRVCSDKEAANQVVECGGVEKLVKICREKSERYDSDAVLVAALATLRKIADSCGGDVINAQDAQELVEPKLLDSFLAYSSQNESYV